jgi:hypothetical protein
MQNGRPLKLFPSYFLISLASPLLISKFIL